MVFIRWYTTIGLVVIFGASTALSYSVSSTENDDNLPWQMAEPSAVPEITIDQPKPPRYDPYQTVSINDPADSSAGIYFRISQRGVYYVADLVSNGLPEILHRLVLPTISDSGLTLKDAVITRLDRPDINIRFVPEFGVDIRIRMPELRLSGDAALSVFFVSYRAQMRAISSNLTIFMRVNIHRNLNEAATKIEVTNCSVNPGLLSLQYYGADASEFYAIGNMIQDGIDTAIRDKICMLPLLIGDFVRAKVDSLTKPLTGGRDSLSESVEKDSAEDDSRPSVMDHLCDNRNAEPLIPPDTPLVDEDEPDVDVLALNGTWLPDPTLRYPPTFSSKDLIVGFDGGIIVDGKSASEFVDRPKFETNFTMLGIIISEYVPNTFFHHIYERKVGSIAVTYSLRHVPKLLRSVAKLACPDCRLVLVANLTTSPHATIDRNGVVLLLEGDISASFVRRNHSYNVLTAHGQIRVVIKPHFRHSRLFSDVLLAGIDLKVYKAGMTGLVAGAVRKLLSFLVPRTIWPKIQQRLRLAVNYKGIQIPQICTVEFKRLHLDYIRHAAVLSGDFDVDLPLLIQSFKLFMDAKLKRMVSLAELQRGFRYL